ncbi:MAG: acyl CoA:acetate/3-ketoacid CoA transferase [Hyphomicrobiales bacterium]|nr:acyl CoA:acetate/3-ketoacid CoA transferase [Hyphomicrobiales bacterium]
MKNKVVSVDAAVAIVRDGDTLANTGFIGSGAPEGLLIALEQRFLKTGTPRNLTLVFAAGQGDSGQRGLNHLGHHGLLKRVVGGHWGLIPKVSALALSDEIEAYNLPQGVISHLYRDIAAGKPGTITKVGLRTFVDPRLEGAKINGITTEDLVQVIELGGEEWLFYKAFPINIAFVRGTTADSAGNITMEKEALILDNLAMAMAARNSGGMVIAQVERLAEAGTLNPRQVQIPGALVDCIVVAEPEHHAQTYAVGYDPSFSGEIKVPLESLSPLPLDERKIIARRCAFELPVGGVINLGIGMPEGVAAVANEEHVLKYLTLTAEPGVIGGLPQSGLNFGAAVNTDAIIAQNQQFDFYDGGGLDMACLGLAECDIEGNLNVSRFGPKLAGAGGFINISQNARKIVFAGTFTAGGLRIAIEDGRLHIAQEGRAKKFVERVSQVTFSGSYAAEIGQPVLYVTERCVFRRTARGVELIEVAPGIDVEHDILAHMNFQPVIGDLREMDPRIFQQESMGLERDLVDWQELPNRIGYDAERNILFLNFEGLRVRSENDVKAIQDAVERRCQEIGRRTAVVVNYDQFRIDEAVIDAYARMVHYMEAHHYTTVTRYTTSAFLRMKLGEALEHRRVAPHVFESEEEARAYLKISTG